MITEKDIEKLFNLVYKFDEKYNTYGFDYKDIISVAIAYTVVYALPLYFRYYFGDYGLINYFKKIGITLRDMIDQIDYYLHLIDADFIKQKIENREDLVKVLELILRFYLGRNKDLWDIDNRGYKLALETIKKNKEFMKKI